MNTLIVHAHPEPKSFCSALKDTAYSILHEHGNQVHVLDLYAEGWNPVGGRGDFTALSNSDYFRYQREQGAARERGGLEQGFPGFHADIARHMKQISQADLVILNFPMWWFGLPAILKGWVDRVFALNVAYAHGGGIYANGLFKGKRAFCCLTTGGSPDLYVPDGLNGELSMLLYPINHGMLYYAGMKVLPPFAAHAPHRVEAEVRDRYISDYKNYLMTLDSRQGLW